MKFLVEYTYETETYEPEERTAKTWDTMKRRLLHELYDPSPRPCTLVSFTMQCGSHVEVVPNPHYHGPYKEQP